MSTETTAGPASAGRCPRCYLTKQPTVPECHTEGWPCYHPFHENWAEGYGERRKAFKAAMAKTAPKPPPTPELERQSQAIKDGAHKVGEFLDWLDAKGYILAKWSDIEDDEDEEDFAPVLYDACQGKRELIAGFFDIDLNKIEAEKLALLDFIREQQR